VIHGDKDRIVPLNTSGALTARGIKGARLVTVEGGPHGILCTHADVVNRELLSFLE
jgi:non-heme chloroperoxidase